MISTTTGKSSLVRAVFEKPQRYLTKRRFDIAIRAEIVQALVDGKKVRSVLDIGCGDGSLSLPLLSSKTKITLLDFSANMPAIARANIPQGIE